MHLPEVINTGNFSEKTNASLYSFEYLLETYLEPCQASMMERSAKIVKSNG